MDEVKRLAKIAGELNNQNITERSKPFNYLIDVKESSKGTIKPIIDQIIIDIENNEDRNVRSKDIKRKFDRAVWQIILNVLQARILVPELDTMLVAVALDQNRYTQNFRYNPRDVSYRTFRAAYDGLLKLNLINVVHKGFFDDETGDAMQTRVYGTDKLFGLIDDVIDAQKIKFIRNRHIEPNETIILKDENKVPVEYQDNKFTNTARVNLAKINAILSSHEIDLDIAQEENSELDKRVQENHLKNPDYTITVH